MEMLKQPFNDNKGRKMTKKEDDIISFEEAFSKLQKIVEKLENETVNLEQALTLFKEGRDLLKICDQHLNTAENKIRTIDEMNQDQGNAS
jgi:exodeoxyribonuclease VII small subunit